MSRRKESSGGQALVMVTLALFSMVGMMGLAVDLGWSYFVQKEAQAAADTAALAAAQEAVSRLGSGSNVSGFRCSNIVNAGTGKGQVECTETAGSTTITPCSTISGSDTNSNLYNGCLYAKQNGFDYTKGTNPTVNMQSGDVTDTANAPPNISRISYWVRVRIIQSIPQLFSFLAGNQQGTIAANATAAIAGTISPGSFFGMNHAGDCWSLPGQTGLGECGVDLDAGSTGRGGGTCPGSGGGSGQMCAPAGVILASTCTTTSSQCSTGWAGNASSGNGVETSSLLVNGTGAGSAGCTTSCPGVPGDWHDAAGNTISPGYTSNANTFRDPTYPNPQPPLQASSAMASCGVTGSITGNLGPYQYFHYPSGKSGVDAKGNPIPDGGQISITNTATFAVGNGCPGWDSTKNGFGGTTQGGSSFPTYVFYGGVTNGGTMNLGPGQYVMAGVNSGPNKTNVLFDGGTVVGDTATGAMMIFTDGAYPGSGTNPGLPTQLAALPNANLMPTLYQGSIDCKLCSITMTGIVDGAVPSMEAYSGVVWWMDRRNSMVEYNENTNLVPNPAPNCASCTADDGTVVGCVDQSTGQCSGLQTTPEIVTDNHVTATSPQFYIEPGSPTLNMTGVLYQPRGSWIIDDHGTGFTNGDLMIIVGAFQLTTGNDKVLLKGPTNPLITYKAVLVQ